MPVFRNKIAFVVPTKDRPDDLRRMLKSVQVQSVHPEHLIIVDGSTVPMENLSEEFPDLNIEQVRVYPPSLSRQRNAGMERIGVSITLAGYLDDDLVLEDGALEAMLSFWEQASPNVGGAVFNIIDVRRPYGTWLKSLFLMDSWRRGAILRSGYHTMICPVSETTHVQWLFGGATVWRREVIDNFSYDEWFGGTGFLEDVDYSYRVGRTYKLVAVAHARVQHLSPPVKRDKNFLLGQWQVINRLYFVRKYADLSTVLCYWALFGQLLINTGKSFVSVDAALFQRALGNVSGIATVIKGKPERIGGTMK